MQLQALRRGRRRVPPANRSSLIGHTASRMPNNSRCVQSSHPSARQLALCDLSMSSSPRPKECNCFDVLLQV